MINLHYNQPIILMENQPCNPQNSRTRRAFLGSLALGATAGLSVLSNPLEAGFNHSEIKNLFSFQDAGSVDAALKKVGKKRYPLAFDGSQANPWPIIWSNVYYITNEQTGTSNQDLGVIGVLRHSGILFTFKDELIQKYELGSVFNYNDPKTGKPTLRNVMWEPEAGDLPEGLTGIKGLMDKGEAFCACDMAYRHYGNLIAASHGVKGEDVYQDFLKYKHEGIHLSPSGVWALGRMSTYGVSYIDASVG